jgi:uncharacterized membrane protein YeaQ/YmgE (transglycosylase-associated protein family)
MSIIAWIVIGGLAGWVASMIMKTDASMGVGANIVVGILGALLGGWIVALFGGPADTTTGINVTSFLVALLGAVVLLGIVRGFQRPSLTR